MYIYIHIYIYIYIYIIVSAKNSQKLTVGALYCKGRIQKTPNPNVGKYEPKKLQIPILFTQGISAFFLEVKMNVFLFTCSISAPKKL